jgi:hypothetical protein
VIKPPDDVEEGRFAGAGRAYDGGKFAGFYMQVYAIYGANGYDTFIDLYESVCFYDCGGGGMGGICHDCWFVKGETGQKNQMLRIASTGLSFRAL